MCRCLTWAACLVLLPAGLSSAGVAGKAVRETAEFVFRKGGKEATELGLETLTRKIESLALKYGDDALTAVKKVGPRTFRIVEEAGEDGLHCVKLLARYGDDALWVATKKSRLALSIRYGDDAAKAMIKHGEIAEPLIESLGTPATGALKAISTQDGRRLAMLAQEGTLAKIGRTDELLAVIGKYGDRGMQFVWRHKGPLAVAAALAAFLADPQPFIDGSVDIAKLAAEGVARPLASGAVERTNWTLLFGLFGAVVMVLVGGKLVGASRFFARARRRPKPLE
jgi:hypothetical protein